MSHGRHYQHATLLDAVEAAQNARIGADRRDRGVTAQAVGIPGRKGVSEWLRRACASAAIKPSRPTTLPCKGPTRSNCTRKRRSCEREIAKLPGLVDVTTDLQVKNPQVNLDIDRDRAAALGLNANQIETALYRRLWSALVVHYLRAHQSVQGAAGGFAQVSGSSPTTFPSFSSKLPAANWYR